MEDALTVSQLIAILQALPNQDAQVQIAMNQEYQDVIFASDIHQWGDDLVVIGE
jgi:hypothetical protein